MSSLSFQTLPSYKLFCPRKGTIFKRKVHLSNHPFSGGMLVIVSFQGGYIPSRELTYPTLGKGKSSSKCHFLGDMLVPWRVYTAIFGHPREKMPSCNHNWPLVPSRMRNRHHCCHANSRQRSDRVPWEFSNGKTTQQKRKTKKNTSRKCMEMCFKRIFF